jgi:hypothetical protein
MADAALEAEAQDDTDRAIDHLPQRPFWAETASLNRF